VPRSMPTILAMVSFLLKKIGAGGALDVCL